MLRRPTFEFSFQVFNQLFAFLSTINAKLLTAGVEYYHVDYVGLRKRFYSAEGGMVATSINYEGLPAAGLPAFGDFAAALGRGQAVRFISWLEALIRA